jgi:hypothetical protein
MDSAPLIALVSLTSFVIGFMLGVRTGQKRTAEALRQRLQAQASSMEDMKKEVDS